MASNRIKQLEKLQMSMPQANQQQAQAAQQARQVQLQEQVKKVQPGQGSPALAQQMGAQQQAQAGQIQLGAAQQGQQQAQLMGQMGLETQAREQRQTGAEQQIALTQNQRETANRLSKLDSKLKKSLLDDQLSFKRDQAGNSLMNERQLLDWAATNARSAEEFAEYTQAAQQVYTREIQLMQAANNKITQALKQGFISEGKPLDRELRISMIRQKQTLEKGIQDKQNKAANRNAMFQAAGSIFGAVAGGILSGGNPLGVSAGASAGSGLGAVASNI